MRQVPRTGPPVAEVPDIQADLRLLDLTPLVGVGAAPATVADLNRVIAAINRINAVLRAWNFGD